MCGIVGYIGKSHNSTEVLLSGLTNLEYRGYDSAGIARICNGEIEIIKSCGPIVNLKDKVNYSKNSNIGIGHTRWATHGVPSIENSHPHKVGKTTIVHNGIIENYLELKKDLNAIYEFKSDTDTEVACALLDNLYKECNDMLKAIQNFQDIVRGSYAIAILSDDEPNTIYVIKHMSPLIIGVGDDETFIASDVPAILEYTKNYVVLNDGDYAKVTNDGFKIYDSNGNEKKYDVRTFSLDASSIGKNGYDHFMLKEINEEPEIAKKLINRYIENGEIKKLPSIKDCKNVTIVACGSAMHAGLIGKYLIEKNIEIPVSVEIASEFRYKQLFIDKNSLVIVISQSGETADTLAAVKIAKENGAKTLGIVNVVESSIAREVDDVIYTEAGSEIAVATTKAYFAQVLMLMFLSLRDKDLDSEDFKSAHVDIDKLIHRDEIYDKIAKKIHEQNDIYFIGRQIDYSLCMEGSLKLKEISYLHSEAYAAGELKHGSIALIGDGTPVFSVITDESIAEKTRSNMKEVKARGAHVILLISEDLDYDGDDYDEKIVIPAHQEFLKSIIAIIPLQLISYKTALLRGCSIDKPKNLAKSVTVE